MVRTSSKNFLQDFLIEFTFYAGKSDALIGALKIWSSDKTKEIGSAELHIEKKEITIASLFVAEKYRNKNYGSLIMEMIKSYAYIVKMPVVLYSAIGAIGFYRKLGFKAEADKNKDKRIVSRKNPMLAECNMYWIPTSMKYRKRIFLIF